MIIFALFLYGCFLIIACSIATLYSQGFVGLLDRSKVAAFITRGVTFVFATGLSLYFSWYTFLANSNAFEVTDDWFSRWAGIAGFFGPMTLASIGALLARKVG